MHLSFTASFFELCYSFWATLHTLSYAVPTELRCILWEIPHHTELYHTLMCHTASCWAMLPPDELPHLHTKGATQHPLSYPTCILHSIGLCCTLLNYVESSEQCYTILRQGALHWATQHLRCTLLSYGAPCRVTMHPLWARSPNLSYAAPHWAMLYPTELCCTLLSYAVSYRATQHPVS